MTNTQGSRARDSLARPRAGHPWQRWLVAAFALLALFVALFSAPAPVRAQVSSVTDGTRTLSASKVSGLSPEGERVVVSGSGYDTEKGIYVAFCVIPAPGNIPTPCGGGADLSGASGSSVWISSNPPSYGTGLAQPYGEGGTFTVTLALAPMINDSTDCRVVGCAIVTRSDHVRISDRSQDIILPVTFETEAPPTPVAPASPTAATGGEGTPAPSPEPSPTPTTAASTPVASPTPVTSPTPTPVAHPAPLATISADGLSAQGGNLSLSVSRAKDLNPNGDTLSVRGSGFDEARGVYVALCQAPTSPGAAPGPCAGGSPAVSAWISSNPPSYGVGYAEPYDAGGSFEVDLEVHPVIDAKTDCRQVACAIATRNDDTAAKDRSQDLLIPVSFGDAPSATQTTAQVATTVDGGDDGGVSPLAIAGAAVVLIVAVVGGLVVFIRRRTHAANATLGVLLLALVVVPGISACGSGVADADSDQGSVITSSATVPITVGQASSPSLPVTVTSAGGRQVTVTDVSRIVSLWGNITEVVFSLGLGGNLVGRDVTATFPEAANLPVVTRGHDVSAESVLSLRPTVVLASSDTGPASALDQIRSVGIPVVQFDEPASVDDIVPRIESIAAALGVPAEGERLAQETKMQLESARVHPTADQPQPRVAFLYLRGQAGVYLLGGPESGADSMIAAVGAIDAGTAMGLHDAFTPITSEALAKAAPDVILMTTTGLESVGGIDGLVKIPGIAQTPAGRNRRVITMEDGLLYSFGPRTPEALRELAQEIFSSEAAPTPTP